METQFQNERQEYEKTIMALEEQSEQREKKYTVRSHVLSHLNIRIIVLRNRN
jgi:hypothetical protein